MRVHLIDGTFELFRAHYSKRPPHSAPGGWDAKATIGVVQSLITLLGDPEEQCTHLAVAFDNPITSFRNALFDGYKTDAGIDPALRSQFDAVEDAVASLGVVVWSMAEFEADDALATAAWRFKEDPAVEQVRILSPDKDLNQCLDGGKVVQVDRIRQRLMNADWVRQERGIEPQSIPDYLALTGDTADGIPGVQGWGEKSTAAVLGKYGHLEAIPRLARDWEVKPRSADRLAQTLDAARPQALLYRTLATLRTDVPLKEGREELAWRGPDPKRWADFCHRLGVPDYVGRPKAR